MHNEKPADLLLVSKRPSGTLKVSMHLITDNKQVAHGHILRAFTKRWLNYSMEFPLSMMIEPGGIGILRSSVFAAIFVWMTDIFVAINIIALMSRLSCLVWLFLSTRNRDRNAWTESSNCIAGLLVLSLNMASILGKQVSHI